MVEKGRGFGLVMGSSSTTRRLLVFSSSWELDAGRLRALEYVFSARDLIGLSAILPWRNWLWYRSADCE